jgi:uncharacterized protein (TIGR03435 family)
VNGRNQSMTLMKATMESFVQRLFVYTGRPVIDKTSLSGTYDIKFEATPAFRLSNNPDPSDISVFQAIQEQLGVIDHVEKTDRELTNK